MVLLYQDCSKLNYHRIDENVEIPSDFLSPKTDPTISVQSELKMRLSDLAAWTDMDGTANSRRDTEDLKSPIPEDGITSDKSPNKDTAESRLNRFLLDGETPNTENERYSAKPRLGSVQKTLGDGNGALQGVRTFDGGKSGIEIHAVELPTNEEHEYPMRASSFPGQEWVPIWLNPGSSHPEASDSKLAHKTSSHDPKKPSGITTEYETVVRTHRRANSTTAVDERRLMLLKDPPQRAPFLRSSLPIPPVPELPEFHIQGLTAHRIAGSSKIG